MSGLNLTSIPPQASQQKKNRSGLLWFVSELLTLAIL